MSVALTEIQTNLIKEIASKEGFTDYTLEANVGSMKGDGFMGIITTVTVKEKANTKTLYLIVKSAQTSVELRKQLPVKAIYIREITMYQTIFPAFKNLAQSKGVEPFTGSAKCYGSSDLYNNECLIFENLKENGYELWNKKLPMTPDHVALVFATYGKYHAFSLAMKHLEPLKYDELAKNLPSVFAGMEVEMSNSVKPQVAKLLQIIEPNTKDWNTLNNFVENECLNFIGDAIKNVDEYYVINHADCWSNNMLFQYKDNGKPKTPTKVCLIDWQISGVASPVFDLSYYFLACSPKEVLDDHRRYLRIYHESAAKTLTDLGCDAEKLYPYAALEDHWKKFSKYGLIAATTIIRVMLSEENEVPDITETVESGRDVFDFFESDHFNAEEMYKKRMRDIVSYLVKNECL